MNLLEVQDLQVWFDTQDGRVSAVNNLSFSLPAGGTLGLVGESGCGKSQTALAILGLLASNGHRSGSVRFEGEELLKLSPSALNHYRGNKIALVFQDPMTGLNPHLRIGRQMSEVLEVHRGMGRAAALAEAERTLDAVHVTEAGQRLSQYPHECSGGMRQRIMIAMALLCRPQLLIADEPTTALDVTVQAQILKLLEELRTEFQLAVLMITHDLGVVAELCDQVMVMYAGQAMESGSAEQLINQPTHPYTRVLLESRPSLSGPVPERLLAIDGQPPDMSRLPAGCPFAPRCASAVAQCETERPVLKSSEGRLRACHVAASAVQV